MFGSQRKRGAQPSPRAASLFSGGSTSPPDGPIVATHTTEGKLRRLLTEHRWDTCQSVLERAIGPLAGVTVGRADDSESRAQLPEFERPFIAAACVGSG